jgi:hypothetical protein
VESSCEFGIEPSGSMKCWELPSDFTTGGLSSSAQLLRASYLRTAMLTCARRDWWSHVDTILNPRDPQEGGSCH